MHLKSDDNTTFPSVVALPLVKKEKEKEKTHSVLPLHTTQNKT